MPRIVTIDSTTTETDDQGQLAVTTEGGTTKERAGKQTTTANRGATTQTQREDSGAQITFVLKINNMGC